MSAKNYATCPQCKKNARDEMLAKSKAVKDQYGNVPEDEYGRLVAEFEQWRKDNRDAGEECLAEYYEHWFEDGHFHSTYRAVCECGFEHTMTRVNEKAVLK
jgi:hypothetical protein